MKNEKIEAILENVNLPAGSDVSDTSSSAKVKFKMDAGTRGLDVSISIYERHALFSGSQTYEFQTDESKQAEFMENMREKYSAYQIFGEGRNFKISRRLGSYKTSEDIQGALDDFMKVAADAVEIYERDCVDFFTEENKEETYDVTSKVTTVERTETKSNDFLAEYKKRKRDYFNTAFEDLLRDMGGKQTGDGSGKFTLDDGTEVEVSKIDEDLVLYIELSFKVQEKQGNIAIASINDSHASWVTDYRSGHAYVGAYVEPAWREPEKPKEFISECHNVFMQIIEDYKAEMEDVNPMAMASDMKDILDEQMEELRLQSQAMEEQEEELAKREADLAAASEKFERDRENITNALRQKEDELNAMEDDLAKREEALADMEQSMDKEKAEYVSNMEKMANEIAKLRRRGSGAAGIRSDESEKKIAILQEKLDSAEMAVAKMENNFIGQMEELKEANKTLREKNAELEITVRKNSENLEAQATQMFADKEREYKETIEDLQKRVDITMAELDADSLMRHLSGVFRNVEKMHGKANDSIKFQNDEGVDFRVVFTDPIFIDASKAMKGKDKDLIKLNTDESSVKFFFKDGRTYARQYIPKTMVNKDVELTANRLGGFF